MEQNLETKKATIRTLMQALKRAGMDGESAVTISLMVRRPGGAEQLMNWMSQNPKATHEEIFDKTREIHKITMAAERSLG